MPDSDVGGAARPSAWSRLTNFFGRLPKWFAVLAFIVLILFLLFVAVKLYQFLKIFDDALGLLSQQYGMNQWLARALAAGFFAPVAWGAKHALSGSWRGGVGRKFATGGYTALYCVGMYLVSRNVSFSHSSGKALQWCAETPEGERCFDSPGYDPKYGLALHEVTPESRIIRERRRSGAVPHSVPVADVAKLQLFDPLTGTPRYYYYESPGGDFELFDSPGFDPTNQAELQPVTAPIAQRIEQWRQRQSAAAARASREAFADRYIDPAVRPGAGAAQWALVVTDTADQTVGPLVAAAAEAIAGRGMRAVYPFRPAFQQDKLHKQLFAGDPALVRRLSLGSICSGIIVGTVRMSSSTSADVSGLINTHLGLHVRLVSASSGSILNDFEVQAQGAGFSRDAAAAQAITRGADALKARLNDALAVK